MYQFSIVNTFTVGLAGYINLYVYE